MGMKIMIEKLNIFALNKARQTKVHNITLVKEHCRLNIRKYSFSNEWNILSTDCIYDSSVNMFKQIDKYIRRAGNMIGLPISQWLPCPLTLDFCLDGNLVI